MPTSKKRSGIKQPNNFKELGKKKKKLSPKVNRRMEITKIREEINRQMMIFKKMKIRDSFLKR